MGPCWAPYLLHTIWLPLVWSPPACAGSQCSFFSIPHQRPPQKKKLSHIFQTYFFPGALSQCHKTWDVRQAHPPGPLHGCGESAASGLPRALQNVVLRETKRGRPSHSVVRRGFHYVRRAEKTPIFIGVTSVVKSSTMIQCLQQHILGDGLWKWFAISLCISQNAAALFPLGT